MQRFESAYRNRKETKPPRSVSETKSAKELPKGVSLSMIMKAMPKRPKAAPLSKAELPRHLEPLASLSTKDVPTVQNRRLFKPEPETGRYVTRPTYRRKDPLIFEPVSQKYVKSSEVLSAMARSKEHRPLLAHPTALAKVFGENWVRQLREVEPTGEYKSALHPKYGMALRKFVDIKSAKDPGVPRTLRYDYISSTVRPMIDVLGYENAAVFAHEHFRHAKQIARKAAKSIFGTLKLKQPQSRKEKRLQRKQLAKNKKIRGELEDMIVDQITRGVRMSFLLRDKAKRGYGVPEYLGLKLDDVIGSRIASNVVGHLAKRRGKLSLRVNQMLDKLEGKVNEAAGMVDEKTGKPKFTSRKQALKHVLSQPENKDIVKTLFPQLGAIVKGIKKSREILQSHLFVAQDKIEEERRAAKEEHLSLKRELDAKAKERAIATGQYVIGKGVKVGDKYKVFRASYFYSPEEKEAYKESRQRLIKAYKKADALTRSMSQIALPVEYKPPTKFTPEHREEESELAEYGKSSMSERRGRRRKPEYQEPAKKKARTRKGKVMYRQTARRQGLV